MKAVIGIGAEVDVVSPAELDATAGRIVGGVDSAFARRLGAMRNAPPIRRKLAVAIKAGGTGVDVLKLGRPSAGRMWNVMYLTAIGNDDRTAVAGTSCAVYSGDADAPSIADLIDPATSGALPVSTGYNNKQLWIYDDEQLFAIVYGAAAGQQLVGVARVLEYATADVLPSAV